MDSRKAAKAQRKKEVWKTTDRQAWTAENTFTTDHLHGLKVNRR